LELFYTQLTLNKDNLDFLDQLLNSLVRVKSLNTFLVLEKIYYLVNNLLKIKIISLLSADTSRAKGFLLSLLQEKNILIRKEAIKAVSSDAQALKKGLEVFFKVKNTWGGKNAWLLENMFIIKELGLTRFCEEYLKGFSRSILPWHLSLRRRAREILKS